MRLPARGTGMFCRNSRITFADLTDGSSQTMMVGERSFNLSYVTWTGRAIGGWLHKTSSFEGGTDQFAVDPEESFTMILRAPSAPSTAPGHRITLRPTSRTSWSRHPGGVNFVFGDGLGEVHQELHLSGRVPGSGDPKRGRSRQCRQLLIWESFPNRPRGSRWRGSGLSPAPPWN